MPKPDWEDLEPFFDSDAFASVALFSNPATPDAEPLQTNAIFDDPFLDAETGEVHLEDQQPTLTCKAHEVAAVRRGWRVEVDGRTFDVLSAPRGDGTGVAVIQLTETTEGD